MQFLPLAETMQRFDMAYKMATGPEEPVAFGKWDEYGSHLVRDSCNFLVVQLQKWASAFCGAGTVLACGRTKDLFRPVLGPFISTRVGFKAAWHARRALRSKKQF